MGAVLDVIGRPIALGSSVVSLIKQRVESFKYKRFILRFNRLIRAHTSGHVLWRFVWPAQSWLALTDAGCLASMAITCSST